MMDILSIRDSDTGYPSSLTRQLGSHAPKMLFAVGDFGIQKRKTLALFCSIKCPGDIILKTYDFIREVRDAGVVVISGFHSPMEKECLDILLKGRQPIIWCPAFRVPAQRPRKEYAKALSDGRLLILSCCGDRVKRADASTTRIRNEMVAALADKIVIPYAEPGGKIMRFCSRIMKLGKPLYTFDLPLNADFLSLGAKPWAGSASPKND